MASAAAGTTTIASVPLSSTIPAIVQQAYQENSMQLDHGIHASGPNGVNTSMPNGTSTVQNRNDQTATNNVASSSAATKPSEESVTGLDLTLYCGPLLNYRRMSGAQSNNPIWHGTVLVVTSPPSSSIPADAAASSSTASRLPLTLRCIGPVASATAANGTGVDASHTRRFTPILLYQDKDKAFWRYELEVPIQQFEARWEYNVGAGLNDDARQITGQRVKRVFAVQARSQSMRIMFHSCNGFSVGTDEHAWNGPALWNDVLSMCRHCSYFRRYYYHFSHIISQRVMSNIANRDARSATVSRDDWRRRSNLQRQCPCGRTSSRMDRNQQPYEEEKVPVY